EKEFPQGKQSPEFPAGTITNSHLLPDDRLSWVVEVLPHIEQADLYNRIDRTAGWDAAYQSGCGQTQLKEFICPDLERETGLPHFPTPYVGVAGIGSSAPWLPAGDRRAGFFGFDRPTRHENITDGTSNTMAILESSREPGPWARGGRSTVRGIDP